MTVRRNGLNFLMACIAVVLTIGVCIPIYLRWRTAQAPETAAPAKSSKIQDGATAFRVSKEARKNMGLVAKPLQATTYFRKIEIPGMVTDRPGISDRGVVAPVTGIVTQIYAYPGSMVAPNTPLFSLRLVSESLHASQLELFKATSEIEIARVQLQRLENLAKDGGVAGTRIIEVENQIKRMEVTVQAYRQDLLAQGLPSDRIDDAAKGKFVTEITVNAPGESPKLIHESGLKQDEVKSPPAGFEVHSLKVERGRQVEAGEILSILADHRSLFIEGKGFRKDLTLIQRTAKEKLPIEVEFEGEEDADWPATQRKLQIQHIANLVDVSNRTFSFFLPLDNQWQSYEQEGKERLIWRFRPGDRVRLSVAVEEIPDVFVLPQAAVVREGPEAFIFRQNGNLFDRLSVHVLHEDRFSIVIANDGVLRKGAYIAQNSAATLNRVLKAQLASGQPTNFHVHADGTMHEAH